MLQLYTYAQALRLFRAHRVRVSVPLSAHALRIARTQARTATRAGLAELAVTALPCMVRATFQSNEDFERELRDMRVDAHTAQVALEMHA